MERDLAGRMEARKREIVPLLTSVENGGCRDVFWKKYFGALADGSGGRNKKASTYYICTESGVLGT